MLMQSASVRWSMRGWRLAHRPASVTSLHPDISRRVTSWKNSSRTSCPLSVMLQQRSASHVTWRTYAAGKLLTTSYTSSSPAPNRQSAVNPRCSRLRYTCGENVDFFGQPSAVVSKRAAVSSDHPLSTSIGMDVLKRGGNAADAAVAAMTSVSVMQPMACGIGGDSHCLFYRNADKAILSFNGSGRTGRHCTLEKVLSAGLTKESHHGLWVSVPGAVAGMFQVVKHFGSGKVSMKDLLEPSVRLAEEGFPLPRKGSVRWETHKGNLITSRNARDLLVEGRAPAPGEIFRQPKLAKSLQNIADYGPGFFYRGQMAENIVSEVEHEGGALVLQDLEDHLVESEKQAPGDALSVTFQGFRIWEMAPNTTGVVALVAFQVLEKLPLKDLGHNSAEYIHIVSEVIKHAYLESWRYLCDPDYLQTHLSDLLSDTTTQRIRKRINTQRASDIRLDVPKGGTSYVCVVDGDGNGCSFISSVFSSFGTGIVPNNCGFPLHNRAQSMNVERGTSNCYGPNKLPLHTIIPALVTDVTTNELVAVLGVVGRWMQPQGQIQVLLNMIIFGMDPQVALNQPRFFVGNPHAFSTYKDSLGHVILEAGLDPSVLPLLEEKGHLCQLWGRSDRLSFGQGHVIARSTLFNHSSKDVWWSGTDPRSDGCAMGY